LLALLVSIITSCQSNDEPNETKNSSENYLSEETVKTIPFDSVTNIGKRVAFLLDKMPVSPKSRSDNDLDEYNSEVAQIESQIAQEMEPFVEIGREIQTEALLATDEEAILNDDDFLPEIELTEEDYEAVNSLDDSQLASLGYVFSVLASIEDETIETDEAMMGILENKYIRCLGDALGIGDLGFIASVIKEHGFSNLINGTRALINAKTVGKLLKALGLRYLGWIGIGFMIYDYVTCAFPLADNESTTNHTDDSINNNVSADSTIIESTIVAY
jgi:hypothetical protein